MSRRKVLDWWEALENPGLHILPLDEELRPRPLSGGSAFVEFLEDCQLDAGIGDRFRDHWTCGLGAAYIIALMRWSDSPATEGMKTNSFDLNALEVVEAVGLSADVDGGSVVVRMSGMRDPELSGSEKDGGVVVDFECRVCDADALVDAVAQMVVALAVEAATNGGRSPIARTEEGWRERCLNANYRLSNGTVGATGVQRALAARALSYEDEGRFHMPALDTMIQDGRVTVLTQWNNRVED